MSKLLPRVSARGLRRFGLLAMLVLATACGRRTVPPASNNTYPTPQIAVGFGTGPTAAPTAGSSPTATDAERAPSATLAPTAAPITVIVTQTVVIAAPTATNAPAVIPTFVPSPTAPPAAGIHCDNPLATITSPPMNAEIHGVVPITGTANTQDFLFYKVQYMPDASWGSERWGQLYQSKARVQNGRLMVWYTSTVDPGVYWLRLVVTRHDGNYGNPCEIRVVVVP